MIAVLRPRTLTGADLLRLVALLLAVALLLQGLLAAQARGLGPLHRHRTVVAAEAVWPKAVLKHGATSTGRHHRDHAHDHAERHVHAVDDATVLPAELAEPLFDAAAFALAAALALAAATCTHVLADSRRHVWRAARAWAWCPVLTLPQRRPPRRA
ncbi:MAG: hypothetical protein IPF94_12985 [Betaproteobacteria bacterium]|nr:hypothetical protein [Betaproteobacteria bacterium]